MAAEYVADTMQATVGQWAGHNRNRSRFGQPIAPRRPGGADRQHPRVLLRPHRMGMDQTTLRPTPR
ncbi:hypothetical protein, partial [Streptomyces sp. NPDC060131]|uniref:hypothetical protein n=1 Tax=Streptomyces sp. NPDC060131 TaxID=3347058 RepID=UPI0036608346